jgi:hypothetical protein
MTTKFYLIIIFPSLKIGWFFLFSFTKYYYFSLLQVNLQFPMMTILFKYNQSRLAHF